MPIAKKNSTSTNKPVAKKPSGFVKVKNTGKSTLNLTEGSIPAGKTGVATLAEVSTLYAHLERV